MVSEVGWPAEEKQKKLWQHSCKLHPGLPRSTRHREPDPGLQGEWSVHLPGHKYLFPATALTDLVQDFFTTQQVREEAPKEAMVRRDEVMREELRVFHRNASLARTPFLSLCILVDECLRKHRKPNSPPQLSQNSTTPFQPPTRSPAKENWPHQDRCRVHHSEVESEIANHLGT